MVKSLIQRANNSVTISTAAALLASSYFVSALLGLFRDRLLAAKFGIEKTLDAYFVAFSIPDLLFFVLVSGALTVTFLPVLTDRLVNHNKKSAWELTSSVLNFLAVLTLIASLVILVFADPLMWLVAPNFDAQRHELAVNIMRIIALNPFLFSLSSVFAGVQQAFGRFFFFALAPVLYNLGIIFGIIFLSPALGIYGAAWGVALGAVAQMLIQMAGMLKLGFKYQPLIFWQHKGFRQFLRLLVPRSLDEGVTYFSAVVERAIASGLAAGSIAAYQYAYNLKNVPITLIGVAIATAVFPKISERAAANRPDLLKKELLQTMHVILWLAIPAAVFAFLLRGYIIRLLLGFGDLRTAQILGWFALAIVFQSLYRLLIRVFYAYQDTLHPLYVSIGAIILNVVIAIALVRPFGVSGLAMAQTLVAVANVLLLLFLIRLKIGRFITRRFFITTFWIFISAAGMSVVTYGLIRYLFPLLATDLGFWTLAPKFTAVVVISSTAYVLIGRLLRLKEASLITKKVSSFIFKRISLQ